MRARFAAVLALVLGLPLAAAAGAAASGPFDVIIRGGTVYDGSGGPPRRADVALAGDRIVAIGDLSWQKARGDRFVFGRGPGFINMLSWSTESLLVDGRSQGEIRQGVTTEIFGEGWSMGPLNEAMKKQMKDDQGDLRFDIPWTTLSEYLALLQKKGVSPNVASYLDAATVRIHAIGQDDRPPTPAELDQMRELVRQEMEAGALGIGSSLIYAPGSYAKTEELIELCKVAAKYQGKYISHLRSEGNQLLEAVDELIRISREAGLPAEIYHLKAAGETNWPKLDPAIAMVEEARREGLHITADMYSYTAGATGFEACVPRWALDGGFEALFKRIQEPETRGRMLAEMKQPGPWENLCLSAGSPERLLLVGFKTDALKPLTGKTLAEVAKARGKDPWDTILDLMLEDRARIEVVFFLMSGTTFAKRSAPWSRSARRLLHGARGPFTVLRPPPRLRQLRAGAGPVRARGEVDPAPGGDPPAGRAPAANLGLDRRGLLKEGHADVVVRPATIADRATYDKPHHAAGMRHVFVNGCRC